MNLEDYIDAHIDKEPSYLERLDRDTHVALVNGRMCSGHQQGRLLKMLSRMISPKKALELGTFSGYSALCIAEGMPEGGVLHTIEANDELSDFIFSHLSMSPTTVRKKIRCHFGDALKVIPELGDNFDLVFIDADKREYPAYYKLLLPLVREGGYLIADNTLWDGHVIEEGRHAPQTSGVIEFNRMVAADTSVEKVIIPIRDGLTIIRKRRKEEI